MERVQTWPEEAQDELVAVANQIESELPGHQYIATQQELSIIDAAMASIDAGEAAADVENRKSICKIPAMKLVYSRQALADLDNRDLLRFHRKPRHRQSDRAQISQRHRPHFSRA